MSFTEALRSAGPASDRAEKMGLYGWLIGDWTMDATVHGTDGSAHSAQGTISAGWVLDGRAIQDVWVLPGFFHGTTLRVYDPGLDAWHVLWSDPLKQYFTRQLGRASGKDIVQEGRNDAGEPTRWRFTDIAGDSFCWTGERSLDNGASWQRQAVFNARRTTVPAVTPMLDHVSIGVRDVSTAKRFYDAALQPLGYTCQSESPDGLGYGGSEIALSITATDHPVPPDNRSGLHFCFTAPSRDSVDAFHAAALRAGGKDNGPPGPRADYGPNYYAAFVVDPDGYRIEAHHDG
jgi:catechol 2,3-dioxygenase-like lactoylglutathione lyase family enzyme